ncbi:thiol-disulfide oxidoreductase ResA [Salibacterium salarium]|uniref:Thiol-disulfide oxidoreductase ResA n=1 Tax=Salibacterium salarium TaxID=284579 RepID=A0A3R9QJU4_9BACI|nr:thiol-disulfide oxidoreductase ResA [Salibacterium salarium]RSL32305.1 thiol-disulfide oxidoreductase ResA [Salibacterium salarium]
MSKKRNRLIMRSSILGVIAVALGYVFYTNFMSGQETDVHEGEVAPNFVLQNMDGEEVELEDLRGKGVFLNFWGTYCPPCEDEMPHMEKQYEKYKDRGVEILAVNVGESDLAVERFVNRYDLTFPVLLDENKDVLDHYGIGPLPSTFLIDEDGVVQRVLLGGMTEENIGEYMEEIEPS